MQVVVLGRLEAEVKKEVKRGVICYDFFVSFAFRYMYICAGHFSFTQTE